jgi:hypothetical protein
MNLAITDKIDAKNVVGFGDPNDFINQCEVKMLDMPQVECPLIHRFAAGMYIREIFIPKNTLLTTLMHLTTHPFFIMKGDVSVWYHDIPVQRYKAPYTGITEAGTRRMLFAHKDTIWSTCHITDLTDPDEIVESVTCRDYNPLLEENHPRKQTWRHNKNILKEITI